MAEWKNQLYYGDNLEILRGRSIPEESVDLVYLDPPFNSQATYNVLYRERGGAPSEAQVVAFEDTWSWGEESEREYARLVESGTPELSSLMQALRKVLKQGDMMAYITMMAPRLAELRQVLRPTGSIYLHCDPTASHYLKLLMDRVFGPENFRNEIVWRRTSAHNDAKIRRFGAIHDTILFYSNSSDWKFHRLFSVRDPSAPKTHDLCIGADGNLYRKGDCRAPGGRGPRYEWNGFVNNWRFTQEEAKRLEAEGKIVFTKTGMPRVLRPADLSRGSQLQDIWTDIDPVNSGSKEYSGYQTQKPKPLLERIIQSSSDKGDVVLDPFCGCGTAVIAAEGLGRRWIGIDISYAAVTHIKRRLRDEFKLKLRPFTEEGTPKTAEDAVSLAESGPLGRFQFQWCMVDKLNAHGINERRKGPDWGVDGLVTFFDSADREARRILIQVKSGKVQRKDIATLKGDMKTHDAIIGVLVTARPWTGPMEKDALAEGFYVQPCCKSDPVRRVQILTVDDVYSGKGIHYHKLGDTTFLEAPLAKTKQTEDRLL